MDKVQTLRNVIIIAAIASLIGFLTAKFVFVEKNLDFLIKEQPKVRILDKYSTENLSQADFKPGKLTVDRENSLFNLDFEPALDGKMASTSGQILIPGNGKYPLIVMIRGYVDKEIYKTGVGTNPAAKFFSQNGFLTIAPDFLGYGTSSPESANLFESRFQTYTTVLALLKSVDQLANWDHKNLFIWAHSNGGQIALTVLEITQGHYPTTLWAPVSSPFPYSILYYEDEFPDYGKFIRKELAGFESDYDADNYSVTPYLGRIQGPIQLHQGTADAEVPVKWSDALAKKLKDQDTSIRYFTYPETDHNLLPSWNLVVQRDLTFFKENLK